MRRGHPSSNTMRRRRIAWLRPAGFTLVELLVSITIIGLLASMILVALAGVTEVSRADRTRAVVARIDTLIMEKFESYKTRRVPRPTGKDRTLPDPRAAAVWSRSGIRVSSFLRELMRLELPDRKSDLIVDPQLFNGANALNSSLRAYRLKADQLVRKHQLQNNLPTLNWQNNNAWTLEHEDSECLYLILSQIHDGDSAALGYFSESEIGDVDQDGMPEILDGWGNPISFVRWAPGARIPGGPQNLESSDPFDLMEFHSRLLQSNNITVVNDQGQDIPAQTFALYPLIFSWGPDEIADVVRNNAVPELAGNNQVIYAASDPPNNPYLNWVTPYRHDGLQAVGSRYRNFDNERVPFELPVMLGSAVDLNEDNKNNAIDNISNHSLAAR